MIGTLKLDIVVPGWDVQLPDDLVAPTAAGLVLQPPVDPLYGQQLRGSHV